MIDQAYLVKGHWYVGDGRLGPLAKWTGQVFVAPDYSMGMWGLGEMDCGDKGFTPLMKYGAGDPFALTPEESADLIDHVQYMLNDEPRNPDVQAWQPTVDKLTAVQSVRQEALDALKELIAEFDARAADCNGMNQHLQETGGIILARQVVAKLEAP